MERAALPSSPPNGRDGRSTLQRRSLRKQPLSRQPRPGSGWAAAFPTAGASGNIECMDAHRQNPGTGRQAVLLFACAALVLAWLVAWIESLGPTLINDEYAAIDYFYRALRTGELYPTPHRLHKPLSVAFGFFSWAFESPLAYEILTAMFAAAFIPLLFLAARKEMGAAAGAASAALVAIHPDLLYYSARGSTIMPFCALSLAAMIAVQKRDEWPRALWLYAGCMAAGGLLRPECWLLAALMPVWWPPFGRGRRAWLSLMGAAGLTALAPLVWFGKDLLINGNLLHGFEVSTRAKAVGTGAPFSALQTFEFFWTRVHNKVSWPAALAGTGGLLLFIRERGLKGLLHPFVLFPAVVSAYVWFIVYMGVYPVHRYWYFNSVMCVVFAAHLVRFGVLRIASSGMGARAAAGTAVTALGLAPGAALLAIGRSPDLGHVMVATSLLAVSAVALLATGREILRKPLGSIAAALITLTCASYLAASAGLYKSQLSELRLEAAIQEQMKIMARHLAQRLPESGGCRVLLPSRRNEQLNWIFRNRELPEVVTFREAFYLNYFKGMEFLELHPDWILYVPRDYQFWGPEEEFDWLGRQDRTVLHEVVIELVKETENIRLLKVTYPPGGFERRPLPKIP